MGIRGSVNLAALALLLGLCATLATPKHIIIGEGKPPILLKNPHSLLSKGVYLNPLSTEMPSNWQQRVTYTIEKNLLIGGNGDCFLANDTVDGWVIDKIISAAPNITLKGVIFDHRCNMNTTQLIEAMKKLKQAQMNVSYSFIAGDDYNNPYTMAGQALNDKIKAIIQSGYCDQLIHDYSDTTIWTEDNIEDDLTYALERSTAHGMPAKKIILALEIPVQEYGKFHYLFDKMDEFHLGGLLFWNPKNITSALQDNRQPFFQSIYNHYANPIREREEGNLTLALQQKINQAIPKMEEFLVFSTHNMFYGERYYWTCRIRNKTIDFHLDGLFVIKNDEY